MKEGIDSFDDVEHDQTVSYYAQPSMAVAVCPVTNTNNTRTVDEYCYYVFKWVGAWSRSSYRWERCV